MVLSIYAPGIEVSASTTTANGAYPPSSSKYVRVVNGSTAIAYVNSGPDNTVAATNANVAVGPSSTAIFERKPEDTYGAVLLSTGTGKVSFSPCGTPTE